jgi:hypothetical protein
MALSVEQKMMMILQCCEEIGNREKAVRFAKEIIKNTPTEMEPETLVLSLTLSLHSLLELLLERIEARR